MLRFRYEYGARPLHLLAALASFAIAGYAVLQLAALQSPAPLNVLIWFLGAIAIHDFILFPLYSLVDRLPMRATGAARAPAKGDSGLHLVRRGPEWLVERKGQAPPVAPARSLALNHLRVPAGLAGLMLLVWFPLILGLGEDTYVELTGRSASGYLGRWLLLSGVLFAGSGLLYAIRLRRARRAG